jgi:hypothetical protein
MIGWDSFTFGLGDLRVATSDLGFVVRLFLYFLPA